MRVKEKNRVVTIALAGALLLSGATSQKTKAEVSTSANLTYVSKYIWRGFDLAPTDEPALQGGVSIDTGKGIAIDVWGSYAMDTDPQIDELDYTLSYAAPLSEYAELSLGYTRYTFPSVVTGIETQTESSEAFLGISFPKTLFGPSLTIYHDWEEGDGTYYYLGLGYDVDTAEDQIPPLSISLGAGYNSGQWIAEKGFSNVDIGLSMSFQAGDVSITPSLNYSIISEDAVNTDNEFWFGLGFDVGL